MPNHVRNILTIKGTPDQVQTIRDAISGPDGRYIDFNKIIPMPNELNGIRSGFRDIDDVKYENWREVSKTTGEVILEGDIIDQSDIKWVGVTAEELRALKKKYGATNWYDWHIAEWGTKWNAYSQGDISPNSFKFDTAWSTPRPVIKAMSVMFPDVTFELDYADEDIGSNVGRYVMKGGQLLEEESLHGTKEGLEKAVRLRYDMSPLEYIDDCAGEDMEHAQWLAERFGIINPTVEEEK